jgi:hydroxyethylthiazole kinase-like uncharacterized protein yjeF
MLYVLTPHEMRAADAVAIAATGEDALMTNAGAQVADRVRSIPAQGTRVVAFAGPGNNGGDAFAALAELAAEYECIAYAVPSPRPSQARAAAEARAREAGVAVRPPPGSEDAARAALCHAIGIDGLFGTGARLPLAPELRHLARALDARRQPVVAIDIPSGVDALTGAVSDDAVRAGVTVTLAAAKPGLLLDPARERAGELWCAPIGIDDDTLAQHAQTFCALDDEAFVRALPARSAAGDKRAAGAPLIVAGSRQFPGAAVLCARAAARTGAGYVTVATPASVAPLLRAHLIEQIVIELPEDASAHAVAEELLDVSRRNGAVAIGPGLGLDERTGEIVRAFLERTQLPVAIDASALFHLTKRLEMLRGKRCVITPHAGEFARLSGKGTIREGERVERIREFVDRTGVTTLLKGRDTLVYEGERLSINTSGTNALATAGSGDVLTGVVATLLAQGLTPFDAARVGAYWHGLAGQRAARDRAVGVVAGEIAEALAASLPGADREARAAFMRQQPSAAWRVY